MAVAAWFMQENDDDDQRSPHHTNPPEYVSLHQLVDLGVLYCHLDPEKFEDDSELNKIRRARGYTYSDLLHLCPEKMDSYEQKLKNIYTEHIHGDEEIRYCMGGSGYFDVRNKDDRWIRISIKVGDLIVLPAGIYHRFTLDTCNYIKLMRLFIGEPVWTSYNRPQEDHPARKEYIKTVFDKFSSSEKIGIGMLSEPLPLQILSRDGEIDFGSDVREDKRNMHSGVSEDEEVSNDFSGNKHDDVDTNGDENKAIEKIEDKIDEPKVGMEFGTSDDAFLHYSRYAKCKGFAVARRSSKKGKDGNTYHVTFECTRGGKARVRGSNQLNPRPQTKIACPARCIVALYPDGKWRLNRVVLDHNHEQSPGKCRFHKSYRVLDEHVKRMLVLNDKAGIKMHKSYASLQIQAGGPDKVQFTQKDCRNYMDKCRRDLLVEGDAEAMYSYFMKMKTDNSDFFYAMDLDDNGQLMNVFWADARSRAACKEFGDVVTFDTTYLTNRYDMPFAPFVGVNHHGQSILLGCSLISHEDTNSFSWLFKTWMTCMWGCAPKAIITDQCRGMKNAIENVFPNTRHRWCIWHIMKKVPEKLGKYGDYRSISFHMHNAVYDSLTIEEFEDSWKAFITKYELQNNQWLHGLYLERTHWIPAFVNDIFWAGMSSTQRSEGMNYYFDGYINSRTTLKQFVEQYENALAQKVESEKNEDMKSWNSYIPCIIEEDIESQFQCAYTNAKVKEFQDEYVGKLKCSLYERKIGDCSEYEVQELITFGEEKRKKRVSFIVHFNVESNEANCKCRLFEFRGMVCRHQLMVFHHKGIERVPDKYILSRWSKHVKRAHTRIQINYDNSSMSTEARRHNDICNLSNKVADLAEDSQEKYDKVMRQLNELKREFTESLKCMGGNFGTPNLSFPERVEVLPSKENRSILDPVPVRRIGRPPTKRKISVVEKIELVTKDMPEHNNFSLQKDDTQESVFNVKGYPNTIPNSHVWGGQSSF